MTPHDDHSGIKLHLAATFERLREDERQLLEIWSKLATTQAVIERASAAFRDSHALLDQLNNIRGE